MKLVRLAALGAVLAAAVALVGVGLPEGASGGDGDAPAVRSITVSGSGSVRTMPDRAVLSFGVTTQAKGAAEALAASSAAMQKVLEALKATGIAAADLQTSSVSLTPRTAEEGTAIVGYTASNTVTATIRDLGQAGAAIDAAVRAGANEVSGPALVRSDVTALYRRALQEAVADARERASALAAASGVALGRVLTVTEGSVSPPVPLEAAKASAPADTPIEPGTQTIEATVTVEFEIA